MKGFVHISVLLSLALLSNYIKLEAQDIHYTQYQLQKLQQTPANAANFDGNYRFSILYRNQWGAIKVPYNTLGFSFDFVAFETKSYNSKFGAGIVSSIDQAGDGKYRTFTAQLPLSYALYFKLSNKSVFKIGTGLYLGLIQKSFDVSALHFDNQYNGEVFDATIPIQENFGNLSYTSLDIGAGYQFGFSINKKFKFNSSLGIHHLNMIKENYLNNTVHSELKQRYTSAQNVCYLINKVWEIEWDYLFQKQHRIREHLVGMMTTYYLNSNALTKKGIALGTYYRWNDAACMVLQYKQANLIVGLSYDINTSPLKVASNNYGATELGLVYKIKNVEKYNLKNKRKCYVF